LRLARKAGQQLSPVPPSLQVADHYFRRAAAADPFDPTASTQRAEWLSGVTAVPETRDEAFRLAGVSLAEAVQRDPFSISLRRMKVRMLRARADETRDADDYAAAIDAAEDALAIYPHDPRGMIVLADCQLEAGEAIGSDTLLRDALASYRRGLDLDRSRPLWAKLAQLRPGEVQAVESNMRRASRLLGG
jgi:hypothetical protein